MPDFANMPLEKLCAPHAYDCPCGVKHEAELRIFRCGRNAIESLPEVLKELGFKKPFVVCDPETYKAAGERVCAILDENKIPYGFFMHSEQRPEPDEPSVGAIVMEYDPSCDVLIAVGSGVINDLTKVVAHAVGRPSVVVGTAPSMDGYASNSSAMHRSGVKVSLYNACPEAIIADTCIMSKAPMRMLWAGLGDMLAKYISICEWRISHIVTGEYYCEDVAALMRNAVKKIVDNAEKLAERDPEAVQAVVEGLVLSGIAMSYAKTSRPASGLEHYFSHVWEMMAMERGTHADLHGIQVGVGTLLTLKLYDWIKTLTPDRKVAEDAFARFDNGAWEDMVRRVFGKSAPQILDIERACGKNDPKNHAKRLNNILANWDEILKAIEEELPPTAEIERLMKNLGMPMLPKDLGVSEEDAKDAFTGAREVRDKYMSCSLLWDIGLTDEARARVRAD